MSLALLADLLGTVGYGAGSVLQAAGANRASGPLVLLQPLYLIGLGCDSLAWIASLVALQQLPLLAVQALLAGSLAITVVLARIFLAARLACRDTLAIAAVAVSLVIVAAAAGVEPASAPPWWFAPALVVSLAVAVAVLLVFYKSGHPTVLALVAGLSFSGAALGARHGSNQLTVADRWPATGLVHCRVRCPGDHGLRAGTGTRRGCSGDRSPPGGLSGSAGTGGSAAPGRRGTVWLGRRSPHGPHIGLAGTVVLALSPAQPEA